MGKLGNAWLWYRRGSGKTMAAADLNGQRITNLAAPATDPMQIQMLTNAAPTLAQVEWTKDGDVVDPLPEAAKPKPVMDIIKDAYTPKDVTDGVYKPFPLKSMRALASGDRYHAFVLSYDDEDDTWWSICEDCPSSEQLSLEEVFQWWTLEEIERA